MTSESQLSAFFSRHRLLLSRERDEEIRRSSLILSNCGPKLLEQNGLALNGLGTVSVTIGLGGKTLIELERPAAYHTSPVFPPHTFRPGDLARVEQNVTTSGPSKKAKSKNAPTEGGSSRAAEGVVYKVSETRIVIAVDPAGSISSEDLDLPERCRVVKLANSVTFDRMEKALERLEKMVLPSSTSQPSPSPSKLALVLLGLSPPSEPSPLATPISFFDPSLNPSQRAAVAFALEAKEVACIHGPPGTGKTWTLIEIVRQLVARGVNSTPLADADARPVKILICGASNLAVDNILERLLALPEKLSLTRVGHPARVMLSGVEGSKMLESTLEVKAGRSDQASLAKDVKDELNAALGMLSGKGRGQKGRALRGAERKKMWEEVRALRKEYRQRDGAVVKSVLAESQIVLATCHSSGGRQLSHQEFDVVIIDEATQAVEAACWIPILKAKKLILAGDPMQLPPTVLSLNQKVTEMRSRENKSARSKDKGSRSVPTIGTSVTTLGESGDGGQMLDSSDLDGSRNAHGEVDEDHDANSVVAEKNGPKAIGLRPPRTLETTLFDRLEQMYGPSIKRLLDVQYRMHDSICTFPSETLYSSKLTSHPSVASHLLRDLPGAKSPNMIDEDAMEVLGTPIIFFDTTGCEYYERVEGNGDDGSRCNENEAIVVKRWVDQLIEAGLLPSQIAVITPYQAQVTLLMSLLRPTYGALLEIGTVDGMQGREKEAIVISLVRSNENREVGFLKEKRRLNVAMTRARRHLCVVGDSSTIQHGGPYLKKWLSWLEANADVRFAGNE